MKPAQCAVIRLIKEKEGIDGWLTGDDGSDLGSEDDHGHKCKLLHDAAVMQGSRIGRRRGGARVYGRNIIK